MKSANVAPDLAASLVSEGPSLDKPPGGVADAFIQPQMRREMQERGQVLQTLGAEPGAPTREAFANLMPQPRAPHLTAWGLPPPQQKPTSAMQVPMPQPRHDVWDAMGEDEKAATAALHAVALAADSGREVALLYIATHAACIAVRVEATRLLGELPTVAAVDLLRELTVSRAPGVALMATFKLSCGTAQVLDDEAPDAPAEVNRCLRDLTCHVQDRDEEASHTLFVLTRRAAANPSNVAEHLTTVAATCRAKVALQAWHNLVALCQSNPNLQELWRRNLPLLQQANHRDVAHAARAFTA